MKQFDFKMSWEFQEAMISTGYKTAWLYKVLISIMQQTRPLYFDKELSSSYVNLSSRAECTFATLCKQKWCKRSSEKNFYDAA